MFWISSIVALQPQGVGGKGYREPECPWEELGEGSVPAS